MLQDCLNKDTMQVLEGLVGIGRSCKGCKRALAKLEAETLNPKL